MLVVVIAPLLWKVSYSTLLIMGIGTSLFIPLYMLPMVSTSFDLMGESKASVDKRVELVVLRELSLMVGRVVGTLVFVAVLSVSRSPGTVTWLLLGLGTAPVGSWLFLRHILPHGKEQSSS